MALSPEEFVKKYLEAYKNDKTLEELSQELGVTASSVGTRVRNYREKGVNLPHLKGSNYGVDPEQLNKLIKGNA